MNDLDHSLGRKSTIPKSKLGAVSNPKQPPSDKNQSLNKFPVNFPTLKRCYPSKLFLCCLLFKEQKRHVQWSFNLKSSKNINIQNTTRSAYGLSITGWWFGTFGLFFHILGIVIPSAFQIFQRGRAQPASTFCLQGILQDWPCSHSKAWESQVSGTRGIPRSNDKTIRYWSL